MASSQDSDSLPRPLPNTYWVVPGRVLAGEYPGDADEKRARDRLQALQKCGIDAFFDLTEEGELQPYRHLLAAQTEYLRSPIADTWVPTNPIQTHEILTAMRSAIARRRSLYVHCRAGIGRTGLVVGCFLADREPDGKSALRTLNRLWRQSERAGDWPQVPQTAEQADYIRKWPELARTVQPAAPSSSAAASARGAGPSSPAARRTAAARRAAPAAPADDGAYNFSNPRFPNLIRRR